MRTVYRFWATLKTNQVQVEQQSRVALGIVIFFVVLSGLVAVTQTKPKWTEEGPLQAIQSVAETGKLTASSGAYDRSIQIFALSRIYAGASGFPEPVRLFLLRLFGIGLGGLALWFVFQTACRIFPDDRLVPILAVTLLATNPQFLFQTGTIGQPFLSVFVYVFFIYQLVEITAVPAGLPANLIMTLLTLFIVSRLKPQFTTPAIVLMAFSLACAFFLEFRDHWLQLEERTRRFAIGGGLAALALLLYLSQGQSLPDAVGFPFKSVLEAAANLGSWQMMIWRAASFFAWAPDRPDSFAFLAMPGQLAAQSASLVALVGLVMYAGRALAEKVAITWRADEPAAADATGQTALRPVPAVSLTVKPDFPVAVVRTVLALATTLLAVLFSLSAGLIYQNPAAISSGDTLPLLTLPLVILFSTGLRHFARSNTWADRLVDLAIVALITLALTDQLIIMLLR